MRSLIFLVTLVAACADDPQQTCSTMSCAVGKTYKACVTNGTTHTEYSFGTTSCSCDTGSCDDTTTATTGGTGGTIGGTGGTNGGTGSGTTGGNGTTGTGGNCKMGGSTC